MRGTTRGEDPDSLHMLLITITGPGIQRGYYILKELQVGFTQPLRRHFGRQEKILHFDPSLDTVSIPVPTSSASFLPTQLFWEGTARREGGEISRWGYLTRVLKCEELSLVRVGGMQGNKTPSLCFSLLLLCF